LEETYIPRPTASRRRGRGVAVDEPEEHHEAVAPSGQARKLRLKLNLANGPPAISDSIQVDQQQHDSIGDTASSSINHRETRRTTRKTSGTASVKVDPSHGMVTTRRRGSSAHGDEHTTTAGGGGRTTRLRTRSAQTAEHEQHEDGMDHDDGYVDGEERDQGDGDAPEGEWQSSESRKRSRSRYVSLAW
jgi:hypothetical protein